jgi:hypothetical protein
MERTIYNKLKDNRLSVTDVHSILTESGIVISRRALQYQIDTNFTKCKDEMLLSAINLMVDTRKILINNLKELNEWYSSSML